MKADLYIADLPTRQGYVYPKANLEEAVQKFNSSERLVVYNHYNQALHPEQLERVVGTATLSMNGNIVEAEITLNLDLPLTSIVQQLLPVGPMQCLPIALGRYQIGPNELEIVEDIDIKYLIIPTTLVETESELHKVKRWTNGKPWGLYTLR